MREAACAHVGVKTKSEQQPDGAHPTAKSALRDTLLSRGAIPHFDFGNANKDSARLVHTPPMCHATRILAGAL